MTGEGQPANRLGQTLTVLAFFSFPPIVFAAAWTLSQNPWQSLAIMLVIILIEVFVGLITGVWQRIQPKLVEGAANDILGRMGQWSADKYRKSYLQHMIYSHRTFDVKGLSTQGPFSLELERVFVNLSVSPNHNPSANLVRDFGALREGNHTVWEFINAPDKLKFAILGAPGSGKTTLLKHITLSLASRNRKSPSFIPDKLPVLLFLRDHAKTILENPKTKLATLIYNSLDMMEEKSSEGWFERHLKAGNCLLMLDGLDEIGDAEPRRKVVIWVEEQMKVHGNNHFIVTSRPHGYRSNPLAGVTQLEVRPFNHIQMEMFVYNWYLANEMMSHQKIDPGVEMEARKGADDLMNRIENASDIAQLAVNPLLLTMIANVHRFRSSLPGRRVELYAEMCEVFLGKIEQARNLLVELTPAQKQSVLQPFAYALMQRKLREVSVNEAVAIITEPLKLIPVEITPTAFLELVRDRSGILLERENGIYGFAHKTFQEYLAAMHIKNEKLENELLRYIENDWWHETIRLYCAQADASRIVAACLSKQPPPISVLVLAIECMEEALRIQQEVREQLTQVVEQDIESEDPQRWRIASQALLARRLRRLMRLDDNIYVDSTPITHAEYQLFLDEYPEFSPDHWEERRFPFGKGKTSVVGISWEAAQAFCDWLSEREKEEDWVYRLPKARAVSDNIVEEFDGDEIKDRGTYWVTRWEGDGMSYSLAEPRSNTATLENWIIPGDSGSQVPSILLAYPVTSPYHRRRILALARASTLANALARSSHLTLAHTFDLKNARLDTEFAHDLVGISNRAIDLNNDLASALTSDLTLASTFARASDLDLDLARDRGRVLAGTRGRDRDLANALARDLANALARALARATHLDLVLARDLTSTLANPLSRTSALVRANNLVRTLDSDIILASDLILAGDRARLALYVDVAQLIANYLWIALVLDANLNLVPSLKRLLAINDFRQMILQQAITVYERQPRRPRFGNEEQWEQWNSDLNVLLEYYALLALLERRRSGEWEAFEELRIVKARRS